MKCYCCNKELKIIFVNTKYCGSCSIHTRDLRMKINQLNIKIRKHMLQNHKAYKDDIR